MKKTFEVELKRVSFVIVSVEAENVDDAAQQAVDNVDHHADWTIESIEVIEHV
jgi:hypothetical protein